jgi:molecular chaperone DnaJ
MRRDYYAVLGVAASASPVEIRRAYQRLARQYSPDVNLWEQEARALFVEIAEAYRVLSDPLARSRYDRQPAPSGSARQASSTAGTPRAAGRRGDDLHAQVEVAFPQAMAGLEADIAVDRLSPCTRCDATGTARGVAPAACRSCTGTGVVWRGRGTLETGPCPDCGGSGVYVSEPCPVCRGRGVTPARSVVRAVLPPGIDTGGQLRVSEEGHAGPFGGPRGDLVIVVRVHDDSVFTRKGDNLYCEVPVTVTEAVLGARIPVPGVDGDLTLDVPAGTQSGQTFRLRSRGVPRLSGGGRGDLYVTVRVEIPRELDSRARELFHELGGLLPRSSRARWRGGDAS